MENDKGLELNLNGERFVATRYNTTLFTFFGRVILRDFELEAENFNHIFLQTSEDDQEPRGGYVFFDHPSYPDLAAFALENMFPQVLNQTHIPECDVRAWETHNFKDLSQDSFPEDWTQTE